MPHGAEALPIAGIAPDDLVLQQFPDQAIVFKLGFASRHARVFLSFLDLQQSRDTHGFGRLPR